MSSTLPDTYSRPGPNANLRFGLSEDEQEKLAGLHNFDGAWSHREATEFLGESRLAVLIHERILGMQNTEMGRMYQLLARGRMSVFHSADAALSLVKQLDRAYMRHAMYERGWEYEVTDPSNPHYKGLADLFPHLNLLEVNTNGDYGSAVLGGKLSGDGHGRNSLGTIATRVKAIALYRNITVILFTPSPRKGQARAETHKSVMTLIHALPRLDHTVRFIRIPRQLERHPDGNTPALLPYQTRIIRQRANENTLPECTLLLLESPRDERIKQAQKDLKVDGVISAHQLARYYGLEPLDLVGRLLTMALIRPVRSQGALEVNQTLVVTDDLAAEDDNELNHRLTLAEMRLRRGIPADRNIWQINPGALLKLNQPDAVWRHDDGTRTAVEADTGRYAMRTVEQKLDSFEQQGFKTTLWGLGSRQRGTNIERRLGNTYRVEWMLATWWQKYK